MSAKDQITHNVQQHVLIMEQKVGKTLICLHATSQNFLYMFSISNKINKICLSCSLFKSLSCLSLISANTYGI